MIELKNNQAFLIHAARVAGGLRSVVQNLDKPDIHIAASTNRNGKKTRSLQLQRSGGALARKYCIFFFQFNCMN